MNIAFCFYTSNTGGVIGTKNSILKALSRIAVEDGKNKYFVIADDETRKTCDSPNLKFIVDEPKHNLDKISFYEFKANKALEFHGIEAVINFGDIPIVTNIKQVFYFDWPYAVYKDSEIWKRMSLKDWLSKKIKLLYFSKNIQKVDSWIVQTELMRNRLNDHMGIDNIDINIIDSGLTEDVKNSYQKNLELDYDFPYLIYPTVYYPHKNIEIILPLAALIKKNKKNLKIILTISKSDHKLSQRFINEIKHNDLEEIVLVKGRQDRAKLIELLKNSRGVFMPTLIESYGLPYIEAQSLGIPIFTSDRDFSRELCKDSAFYFDPLDPEDIYKCINDNIFEEKIIKEKLIKQEEIFKNKITWLEAVSRFITVLEK